MTILFTDIQGSTALGEREGDEASRAVLRAHDELVRKHVAEHGGREVKHLGDGFMVSFPSTRRGLACAVQIQKAIERKRIASPGGFPLVRMGLNAGEVLSEDDDLFGNAVSATARIMEEAAGGRIVVSDVVRSLAGTIPGLTFEDRGLVTLKGFDNPCRLFEVQWEREEVLSAGDRTPFVGREAERAQLRGFLEKVGRSEGSVVLIGGEPGVGKTRLVEEMLGEAETRDFRTLTGRCYEMDAPPPFLPFVELLEEAAREVDADTFRLALGDAAGEIAKVMPQLTQLFDDIPAPLELPPEQERRYIFNSVLEFVHRAASIRPLVVLLDDIHWADDSSLLLLEHIAGNIAKVPVLLLGTYRDSDLDAGRPLARTLETLIRRRDATRLHVRRLGQDSVREMLARLAGSTPPDSVVDAIFNETDGNAFFVEEVFRHLSEEGSLFETDGSWRALSGDDLRVPESVRLVVGRRLERLAETTLKVLKIAAVTGPVFSYDVLPASNGESSDTLLDAVDEAEAAKLIVPADPQGSYTFAHELIRQTLLTSISLPRRQRMHLQIATAMESLGRDDPTHHARLAHHFFQAGSAADPATARRYLRLAGDAAIESAAYDEALRFYDEALALGDELDQRERAALLHGSGTALRSLGRRADSMDRWREALDIYEALGDKNLLGVGAADLAFQLGWAGQWTDTFEIVARALGAIGSEVSIERCGLLAIGALSLSWAGAYDQAEAMLDECAEVAEALDSDLGRAQAIGARGSHEFAWALCPASVRNSKQAADMFQRLGDPWRRADAMSFELFARLVSGDNGGARRVLDELEPLGERLGHLGAMLFSLRARSILDFLEGADCDLALDRSHQDLDLCERYEMPWVAQSYLLLGQYSALKGEIDAGLDYLQRGKEAEPIGALWGWGLGQLLLLEARRGNTEEARRLIEEAKPELPDLTRPNMQGAWELAACVTEAAALLGDADTVALVKPIIDHMLSDHYERGPLRWDGRLITTLGGMAARALGDTNEARDRFEASLAYVDVNTNVLEENDVHRFYGSLLLEAGSPDEAERARRMLERAAQGYRELGLESHLQEVERILATA